MPVYPRWLDPSQDSLLTPTALKGLVHPIRLRLLDLLQADGPATATSLGRRIEQSSGATSYHLRVLAEHGFIVEDTERGSGRDRWWRAAHRTTAFTFRMSEDSAEEAIEAGEQFMRLVAQESHRRTLAFVSTLASRRDDLAQMPWTVSDWPVQLTVEEAFALKNAIAELVVAYRRDPGSPDPRADTVRAHVEFQFTPEEP